MRMKIFLTIISVICLGACIKSIDRGEVNQSEIIGDEIISFYVAGHTYGNHSKGGTVKQDNMHPPFTRFLPKIAKDETIEFGILTGDTVIIPSERSFLNLIEVMEETEKPYYIAPGNHDLSDGGTYYDNYFGDRNQSFLMENNLFIILTPIENWSIADEQLKMIQQVVTNNPNVDNIFIFTHYLIWLEKGNNISEFEDFQPNGWTNKKEIVVRVFFWTHLRVE